MSKVAIVYYSKTDITGQLVQACAESIQQEGAEVVSYLIEGKNIIEGRFEDSSIYAVLEECDAIIFASPTYMGNVSAQFKTFVDASGDAWYSQKWSGKVAAGITCGGAPNGDQANTLQYMQTLACQHGMYWVSLDVHNGLNKGLNRLGCQLGVVAQSEGGKPKEEDLATAVYLGKRVTTLLNKLKSAPEE
ncbi:MAG: flavodoxin family protein [Fibrobacterales bacterium]